MYAPSRILTWHRNETRSLAIADLIRYSAHEEAGLPDMAFVGTEKFLKIYIILHHIHDLTCSLAC